MRGALDLIEASIPGAAGHELRAAAHELRLGAPTEATLERLRRRAAPAWDALIAGILLQRDAGGDLPALLRQAGLTEITATDRTSRRLGRHTFYRASR